MSDVPAGQLQSVIPVVCKYVGTLPGLSVSQLDSKATASNAPWEESNPEFETERFTVIPAVPISTVVALVGVVVRIHCVPVFFK